MFSEWLRKVSVASLDMPHRGSAALSSDLNGFDDGGRHHQATSVSSEVAPTRSRRFEMILSGTTLSHGIEWNVAGEQDRAQAGALARHDIGRDLIADHHRLLLCRCPDA